MNKELNGISMGKTWLTYLGSAFGVLEHARLWDKSVKELTGFTGMAFQFIVHERFCPSSVTVYDWGGNHHAAMDRIGVYTDSLSIVNSPGMNTFKELQIDAIGKIKESIDAGRGVVVWAPTPVFEFDIITGYDEEEKIFSVIDCENKIADPLMFDNLGRSEVPYLYLQRFFSRTPVDREKMYRDAISFALSQWQARHFNRHYALGSKAYDYALRSLAAGDYNPFGLSYVINVYADTKRMLAAFFDQAIAEGLIKGLEGVAEKYHALSRLFAEMALAVPFRGPQNDAVDKGRIPEMIKTLKKCKKVEADAMEGIKAALED